MPVGNTLHPEEAQRFVEEEITTFSIMDIDTLRHAIAPDWWPWILAALGLVVTAATLEGLVRQWWFKQAYDWRAWAASLADAVGRRLVDGLGLSLVAPLLLWVYQHRLTTLTLDSGWMFLALFFGEELCYYGYHRAAHRIRWFWATHAVHHSPNELTLATALRLGWTGKLTGTALFFAPLVWVGFDPLAVFVAVALNLLYQFWIHAAWIPRLGPLEWVFNTPAHHRVHHASNPAYLDRNYGGVLIIFDRLFGTFASEQANNPPRYGLTTPLHSHNPIYIALHEWLNLGRDLWASRSWADVGRALLAPPGAFATARAQQKICPDPGTTVASATETPLSR